MKTSFLGGIASLVLWIVLVVVVEWRSGLAHIPLALAAVLIARGIVLSGQQPPTSS